MASAEYQAQKHRLLAEVMPSRRSREYMRKVHALTAGLAPEKSKLWYYTGSS